MMLMCVRARVCVYVARWRLAITYAGVGNNLSGRRAVEFDIASPRHGAIHATSLCLSNSFLSDLISRGTRVVRVENLLLQRNVMLYVQLGLNFFNKRFKYSFYYLIT